MVACRFRLGLAHDQPPNHGGLGIVSRTEYFYYYYLLKYYFITYLVVLTYPVPLGRMTSFPSASLCLTDHRALAPTLASLGKWTPSPDVSILLTCPLRRSDGKGNDVSEKLEAPAESSAYDGVPSEAGSHLGAHDHGDQTAWAMTLGRKARSSCREFGL